jgi:hypothetical protein
MNLFINQTPSIVTNTRDNINTEILVYLLRICFVDGCIIILYSNTQQDANNKDTFLRH